jgi:hypothetical protein
MLSDLRLNHSRRCAVSRVSVQGLSIGAPASSTSFRFNARISSKRLVTSRMIATKPIIWPLLCSGTIVNSTDIVAPCFEQPGPRAHRPGRSGFFRSRSPAGIHSNAAEATAQE